MAIYSDSCYQQVDASQTTDSFFIPFIEEIDIRTARIDVIQKHAPQICAQRLGVVSAKSDVFVELKETDAREIETIFPVHANQLPVHSSRRISCWQTQRQLRLYTDRVGDNS